MLFRLRFILLAALFAAVSCGGAKQASSPIETFKTYTKAIKAKDTTTMKLLLSDATIKMHAKEAKAQNVTVDDIVKRETLFSESQKSVEFRNEKINGDKATLEVKNSFGSWETVPFVLEDGSWKIDKAGYAEQMIREIDEQNKQGIGDALNGPGSTLPTPEPFPSTVPEAPQQTVTPQ